MIPSPVPINNVAGDDECDDDNNNNINSNNNNNKNRNSTLIFSLDEDSCGGFQGGALVSNHITITGTMAAVIIHYL
jgi:hypothetical protein